ncbi:hypothetical protein [Citreimonas sp.]|uniref:hypothetical protein n=1 Tax=Citreimonas sp. TaxID=3036715 RepID=UPI004058930B
MPAPLAFLKDPDWRREVLSDAFGKGFWGFFAAAAALGVVCWLVRGQEAFVAALWQDLVLLAGLMPRVIVALSIASLVFYMLPRDRISGLVGQESGFRGLLVATAAGTVTPGGPSSAYALLAVLGAAGADRGAMVAYITAWALLGVQRILVWDVPFMGAEFAILRLFVSLPLPVIAGLVARRLPLTLRLRDDDAAERDRPEVRT